MPLFIEPSRPQGFCFLIKGAPIGEHVNQNDFHSLFQIGLPVWRYPNEKESRPKSLGYRASSWDIYSN